MRMVSTEILSDLCYEYHLHMSSVLRGTFKHEYIYVHRTCFFSVLLEWYRFGKDFKKHQA